MRAMLPDADPEFHRALAEDYKLAFQRLRGNGLVDEPLYEGIAELVEGLGAEGWLLGVATGKSDRGLTLCLEHHGLRAARSEEQKSELQSLKSNSCDVFC